MSHPLHLALGLVLILVGCTAKAESADDVGSAEGMLTPSEAKASLTPEERTTKLTLIVRNYSAATARTFVEHRPYSNTSMASDALSYGKSGWKTASWEWPELDVHILELSDGDNAQLRFYNQTDWYIGRCPSNPERERLEGCTIAP